MDKNGFLPVTALQYVVAFGEEYLLSGEGPYLKIFAKNGQLLSRDEVLPFRVVHGIRPLKSDVFLVFGQKAFQILQITKKETEIRLELLKEVEVSDWILEVAWMDWKDPSNYRIALVTAHNVLVLYNVVDGTTEASQYRNQLSSILYSALVWGQSLDELVLASGTVFNQILLWHVRDDEGAGHFRVRINFVGHQGVIFSIQLNSDCTRLVSASDDRTVRVWSIPADWRSREKAEECGCLVVLYGHTARVWKAIFLPGCIVSVGEDATCRVWSYEGQALNVFTGHRGKSIWSMAVNMDNTTVATGGGDCSIRLHSLIEPTQSQVPCMWMSPGKSDDPAAVSMAPRCVFLMGQTALCLMDDGSLFACELCNGDGSHISSSLGQSDICELCNGDGGHVSSLGHQAEWSVCEPCNGDGGHMPGLGHQAVWSVVHKDTDFSGYSIGALSDSHILALGNIHGSIKLLRLDEKGVVLNTKQIEAAYDSKVFSLSWCLPLGVCCATASELLFTCGADGKTICWQVSTNPLEAVMVATFTLPSSKHRWLTTVSILKTPGSNSGDILLCGDRRGSLHLYQFSTDDFTYRDPNQTLHGVHGSNGVTYSCFRNNVLYTCGRNGMCRKFVINDNGRLKELAKFKPVKGLEWIEKIFFNNDDMLVLGFHGTNLIIHSTTDNRRVLDVPCGGGHRSYAISSVQEILRYLRARVLYIKKTEICFCNVELGCYFTKSLIQKPFAGLQAVSLVILHSDPESGGSLVAVGSEDSTISLVQLCPRESSSLCGALTVLHTLQGHLSSVRALSTSASGKNQLLLFSGGARASLKVWSIKVGIDIEASLAAELFLNETFDSKMTRRKRQRSKFEPRDSSVPPECRIMSLTSFPLSEVFPAPQDGQCNLHGCHYVALGCSDAIIRQYVYTESRNSFSQLQALKASNKCVLVVRHFHHHSTLQEDGSESLHPIPVLCSASTDGCVMMWDIHPYLKQWISAGPVQAAECSSTSGDGGSVPHQACLRVHRSGINEVAIQRQDHSLYVMICVGDDNALTLSYFKCTMNRSAGDPLSVETVKTHINSMAHSSAITGGCFIGEGLAMTTSIDQRLNIWKFAREEGLKLVSSHTHNIADPTSLAAYNTREGEVVAVYCGIGLQYILLKNLITIH